MPEEEIGSVSDFFAHPVVAGIDLTGTLKVGDQIHIKGHTTDLTQTVTSIQIDRAPITAARKGQEIGLLVNSRVRRRDSVYKL